MAEHTSEVVARHVPCTNPACGSSDGMDIFDDGHTYCYVCETYTHGEPGERKEPPKRMSKDLIPLDFLQLSPLRKRGISEETCRKYGYYTTDLKDGRPAQVACHFDDSGNMIAQKIRTPEKDFWILGNHQDRFVGQHLFHGGKKLVVTEGEIDMLTVSQVQGNKYPVVSIPQGSNSAKKTFQAQMEWLERFDEVITMFDMDEPGEKARKAVEGILSPGRLKHATLPRKDPNDCLQDGLAEEITRAVWNAKVYKPDGIVNGNELWDALMAEPEDILAYPYPWDIALQDLTVGIRPAELWIVTAGSGVGKTTFVRQLSHHLGARLGLKTGLMMLEENPKRTVKGLMSVHMGKRLHISRKGVDPDLYRKTFEATVGTGNFVLFDHFGSTDGDNLLNKIRYLAIAEECKFIILDHISIAISGLDSDKDERRLIDYLMTKMRQLVEETGVGLIVVSHLRKVDGKAKSPFEEGGQISMDDLRGSGALKQLSDVIIALERNQQAEDSDEKNTTRVRLLKDRITGETGIAGYLFYNKQTDRLEEAKTPEPKGEPKGPFGVQDF